MDTGDSSAHFYVVHEGQNDSNCARLKKITYTLGTPNEINPSSNPNVATVESDVCLTDFDGLLTGDHGVEAMTLYKPSDSSNQPEFLMGVQKTGIIYSVKGDGTRTTNEVLLPATGRTFISGSQYFPSVRLKLLICWPANH